MRSSPIAVFLLTCLLAGDAAAQDFSRPGPYLGLAGTVALTTILGNKLEEEVDDLYSFDVGPSLGLHARGGYRLFSFFAAEIHYEWLEGFEIEAHGDTVSTVDGWTLTADGKLFLLTQRVQPFLLAGIGAMQVPDVTNSLEFAGRVGGGIDVYVTENVVLGMDATVVLPDGALTDFVYFSLGWGVQYRF